MADRVRRTKEAEARRRRSPLRSGQLVLGIVMFAIIALVVILAPIFFNSGATELGGMANLGSTSGHPLGTDTLGRDMLARTLVAARTTTLMALAATALAAVLGIALGVAVWLAPHRVREVGLRAIEFAVSYPALLVAIIVAAVLGQGVVPAIVAIGIANTASFARLTANLAAGLASREFVVTARLMGVPVTQVATRHVLPNMAEPLLILIAQAYAGTLVQISGLSFVGLGVQSPSFDWGTLLQDGLSKITTNPILVVGPSVALVFTALAALSIGDGLASMANPRSNQPRARLKRGSGAVQVMGAKEALLVAEGITVRHASSGRELVKDLSFTIGRGEVVGIVGESGSGKSLTASVVARLLSEGLDASARCLTLGNTDLLGRVSQTELASRIALVYQDPGTALNPALPLGSQLSDVLVRRLGKKRRQATAMLVDSFASVLLPDPEGHLRQYPHQLSGGMKQRAMIASAMASTPELLIADEPTTALDVTVQREVLGLIKRMNRDLGTSVLFISHDLGVVRALCDRVLVMKSGTVVESIDDAKNLTVDAVTHPYTKQLLLATTAVEIPDRRVDSVEASQ